VLSFLDLINGIGREIARVEVRGGYQLRLSPDGERIALLSNVSDKESQIRIVSTENGSVHSVSLKDWYGGLQSVSWAPDGNGLYVTGWSCTVDSVGLLSVGMEGEVKVLVRAIGDQAWFYNLSLRLTAII
jgi:hypothetical protein